VGVEVIAVARTKVDPAAAFDRQGALAIQLELFCGVGRYVALF